MKALTAAEMRDVDRLTTERYGISGAQLMEHAGSCVADVVRHQISLHLQSPVRQIIVLCGKGNNGGDGFVAARHLQQEFRHTVVVLFGSPQELRGDSTLNFKSWNDTGGETILIATEADWNAAFAKIKFADVVLDALLGTGLRGAATGLMAQAIEQLNTFSRNATAPRPG